ncbi:receptor-type tyrosine-protein phosphatase eta [Lampris incognitus]|uniref:receptor-type tyrosine-protein phosphatase eta n=1 Tax=Lampris incognitus TaxID=2546036 RepID=UPI0024B5B1C0|nr:receptor-type tyrosine-protein phosphatase eta [Lampris incognitus]
MMKKMMKRLLRASVFLWAVLLMFTFIEISKAECDNNGQCMHLKTIRITTTTVNFTFPSCNLTIENQTFEKGVATGLTPGANYEVNLSCFNCCKTITMKPEVVRNLIVTDLTASSVSLSWIEPEGNSSFYRVKWTDGERNGEEDVNETNGTVTNLTAGTHYELTVTAFADDEETPGNNSTVHQYTKPEVVRNLTVTGITTTSVSLSWIEPEGNSSHYKVEWTNGSDSKTNQTHESYITIPDLTPGVLYTFRVKAATDQDKTEGNSVNVSQYTKPEVVRNLTVTGITTTSVSLSWIEPEGNSSHYKVEWTNGSDSKTNQTHESYITIPDLTPGVLYTFRVKAATDQHKTEGNSVNVSQYTKPEVVRNLTVPGITTTSVSLSWIEPEGNSSHYKVEWTNGSDPKTNQTHESYITIPGLTPGVLYTFRVRALTDQDKTEGNSVNVSQYTEPEVVRNLTVTGITTTSVSLSWIEPEGNSSHYKVEWTNGSDSKTNQTHESYITIPDLTPGVLYTFRVKAVTDQHKTEGNSVNVSQYTKPEVVRNLTVTGIATTSVSLSWIEPEGNSSHYKVEWTNGSDSKTNQTHESYITIPDLTPGVLYTFRVKAVTDQHKTEGYSVNVSQYTKPEVVRNLTVTGITTTSVSLSWIEPEGNRSHYKVEWTNGSDSKINQTHESYITIHDLTPGVLYKFRVRAATEQDKTEGNSVNVSQYTKPEIVKNLTVTGITTTSVSLSWIEPEGNSSHYKVEWTNGSDSKTNQTHESYITIPGLTSGVLYTFRVRAVTDQEKTEGNSINVSQYTKPEVVRNLTVTGITTTSVSLSWIEPEGNSSHYKVEWTNGSDSKINQTHKSYITIPDLTPGVLYTFRVKAVTDQHTTEGNSVNVSQYTKPEVVRNLTVTGITTTSVSLSWIEPEGNSSHYKVEWTNGSDSKTNQTHESYITIPGLTPGVLYTFRVKAATDQHKTEGYNVNVSQYTKPEVVRNLTVTGIITTSVSLSWIEPEGNSSHYKVEWTNGSDSKTNLTHESHITIPDLTPGVLYTFRVRAVTDQHKTEGNSVNVSQYTKPGLIGASSVSQTTSSVSLNWTKPAGGVLKYRVEWHNGGTIMSETTNNTFVIITDLIAGTNYTMRVIAIAEDNQTEGGPRIFSVVTTPDVVRNLSITEITTSSVALSWNEPEGNATSYVVEWMTAGQPASRISNDTAFTIIQLIAGFQYNITVAAIAGNWSNEGAKAFVTTFTRPEKPENIEVTARGINYLRIEWTLPGGNVDHYQVHISNRELNFQQHNSTEVTMVSFSALKPGRIYEISVTAVAGNVSTASDNVSEATVPTRPGDVIISQKTNNSLHLEWTTPVFMEGASDVRYNISYQPKGGAVQSKNSSSNSAVLSSLSSGTFYNISVETVGPQGLRSAAVWNSTYTIPNPVLNLIATPENTDSVKLQWSEPQDVQTYYTYRVETSNTAATPVNNIANSNSTVVTGLEPGTRYNFNVSTVAAPGSESTMEQAFSYTLPKAVTNLIVSDLNTSAILLTWNRQNDHKPTYSYLVIALKDIEVVHNVSTDTEMYIFTNLTPGEIYIFRVFVVVDGVKSAVQITTSHTKPGTVSKIIVTTTTSDISVSWTAAVGQVDSYSVLLYRGGQLESNQSNLINTTLNVLFEGLKPGTWYSVKVVTTSGPFSDTEIAPRVHNATFPNPPGPIMVKSQTPESINISWALPEGMELIDHNFTVFYTNQKNTTTNNWFLLENLQSGTAYNITVITIGVNGYQSTPVTIKNYTRPYSVSLLRQAGISLTEVTLVWDQPESKSGYSYSVELKQSADGSCLKCAIVFNTTFSVSGLVSGTNYTFTVTTQTADGTQATPVKVFCFTRPYNISGLAANTLNTTAIYLNWTKPHQYKNGYKYRVETTGCAYQNQTLEAEETKISELTPGTKCKFCVFVKAEDSIESTSDCIFQYTHPEAVQPVISNIGSNSTILVSWAAPLGNVEHYMVSLNSSYQVFSPVELNSPSTSVQFDSLSAGRLYTSMVSTTSGPFTAQSGYVTNATSPNSPGPISILMKTTSSIWIEWKEAHLMANASFHYIVGTVKSLGTEHTVMTNNTNHVFSNLSSGTPYNISVATIGPMGFKSEEVCSHMVTTRPESVKSLEAFPEEESVTLRWIKPDDYKQSYHYYLTWGHSTGPISNKETTENAEFSITELIPGSPYDFNVTTETVDETKADPVSIYSCTNASPVSNLRCHSANGTEAKVVLSWSKPKGRSSSFLVIVEDSNNNTVEGNVETNNVRQETSTCNPDCYHTVSNLKHYTEYNIMVKTQSCGKPSTFTSQTCMTGITDPPIPGNYESMVKLAEIKHNMFSIQINASLLNSTNGPVTHYGVLVTNNSTIASIDDASNLKQYLMNTYQQWSEDAAPAYLATVRNNPSHSRSGGNHLTVDIGDGSVWKGYTNGALKTSQEYRYAVVLFTHLSLLPNDEIVDAKSSLVSTTAFYSAQVNIPSDNAVIFIAVGATLGIFCVLIIIVIGFIIYWKRLSMKESSDIQIHSMRAKVNMAIRVEDYETYYRKQKADSNCGFAEEFEDLKHVGTAQAKTSALHLENKPKNRYNNVLPYDSSRVRLSINGSPFDDYINANYIPGYNSRKEFIAAQGPLPCTVNEFWRMIWEKNVQTLVMLTRCNEQGRVKCERYWPSTTKPFENITVTTTSEIPLEDWTIRDFDIKNVKTAETRSVRHFHFTAWPDHGVPETTELLINFRHLVREHMDQYSRNSPTVVHCSAGVGRTGTFIAIDRLIFQIERDSMVDVYGIIHDLRMHRPLMVQTEDQYVFLNQCAMDIIRSRTGTNVDLIYQNTAALNIYENVEPRSGSHRNGYHNA